MTWSGIFSAVTTQFDKDGSLSIPALESHMNWQINMGVDGLIVLGSLGENGVLLQNEKLEVIKIACDTGKGHLPVLACVAESSTALACRFVETVEPLGVDGLMLLPAMQYVSDRRETLEHYRTVARATGLPIMIYNNPVAYRVDITPDMFAELADEPKFVALKESSGDVQRITDIRKLVGERYRIFSGVDELALEGFLKGAVGWVAGLVCAFPRETVALYRLVRDGHIEDAKKLFRWFEPLLKLDSHIKFVQYIKFAEAIVGAGTEYVRAPRLTLVGEERAHVEKIIRDCLASHHEIESLLTVPSLKT